MDTLVGRWITAVVVAWQCRRSEAGGVADDTVMIGLLLAAALAVGLVVAGAMGDWIDAFDFGI
jgi:hypothetical protein